MNSTSDERREDRGDTGWRESLDAIARAMQYVAPFKGRFSLKALLLALSFLPSLVLPWPIKILIDNVIGGRAIAEPIVPYQAFIRSIVMDLDGLSHGEILVAIIKLPPKAHIPEIVIKPITQDHA